MDQGRDSKAIDSGAGTVWITGLSASGKSTLANALCDSLRTGGVAYPVLIDGEYMRERLGNRYGHSLADRRAVLTHIVEEALQARLAGRLVVVATISHTRPMRAFARKHLAPFMEVYLDCPSQVCAARDRKGHYARAARGEYDCFIGVTHPYERWKDERRPELVLDTHAQRPLESSRALERAVRSRFALAAGTEAVLP